MEATREIYWNVGHGVVVPMYLFAALAMAICCLGLLPAAAGLPPGETACTGSTGSPSGSFCW